MNTFHFLRPYCLWLTLVPAVLVWLIYRSPFATNPWARVCDEKLLGVLMVGHGLETRRTYLLGLFFAWLVACMALAGPTWKRIPQPIFQRLSPSVIVLDSSYHMLGNDIQPSRMQRAIFKIHDILKQSDSAQIGLVAFAKVPYVISPLTQDAATISAMLPELSPKIMPEPGSNIASALQLAKQLLEQGGLKSGSILLITASPVNPAAIARAKDITKAGFSLSVLGVATTTGVQLTPPDAYIQSRMKSAHSRLDEKGLKRLAAAGKGSYIPFSNTNRDSQLWLKHLRAHEVTTVSQQQSRQGWYDYGRYFIWLILPIMLAIFRRGLLETIA